LQPDHDGKPVEKMNNRIYADDERILRQYRNADSDKLNKLGDVLRGLAELGFTGYIKINFSQGNIGRVEKFEEILKK
jgi:hypothetical protein